MGGKSRNKLNKSKSRRPRAAGSSSSSGNRGLFVEGGFLSDWSAFNSPPSRGRKANNGGNGNSRSGNAKGSNPDPKSVPGSGRKSETQNRGNAISYHYPQENASADRCEKQDNNFDTSNPMVLIDSEKTRIVAFMDEGKDKKKQYENVEYMYDYTTSFTLDESPHRGLGFYDEVEATPDGIGSSSRMEEKESGSIALSSSEEEGDIMGTDYEEDDSPGYLLIGGTKIYTRDISDDEEEEEEEEESSDEEDSSETSESDSSSYSGSDVDDEVAADYFEGIGGNNDVINVDQLVGKMSDVSDFDSDSEDSFDETVQKLSGIDLQEASREYGMKNPELGRKYRARSKKKASPVKYDQSPFLDDLMFVKDPRTSSGKKKHAAKFPQSWPSEARKSKKQLRRMPGEKKKHRKEMIVAKRRDRMLRRGVDLQKINLKLEQMVLDGTDILSFPPMHPRDCSQIRRLASIYRLQSGCQGSGKKRFVTVLQTQHTCMPSSIDKIRLEKLIGANDEDADFSVIDRKPIKLDNTYTPKKSGQTPLSSQSSRKKSSNKEARKSKTGKIGSYAAEPVSFVSSGNMTAEIVELKPIEESNETKETCPESNKFAENTVQYAAFEMHTTGFGSKMMAKMGYIEGEGLGKDGQGMSKPIEVSQRPKSLGLGAQAPIPATTDSQPKPIRRAATNNGKSAKTDKNNNKLGSFERHTKGFGSKMMAKMGFVEGMGLGRDSQGIVNPLVAVRRPKARGLGATKS